MRRFLKYFLFGIVMVYWGFCSWKCLSIITSLSHIPELNGTDVIVFTLLVLLGFAIGCFAAYILGRLCYYGYKLETWMRDNKIADKDLHEVIRDKKFMLGEVPINEVKENSK